MIGAAPLWLSIFFSMHIVMVNLGIGLAWIVPYLKYRANKDKDRDLEASARELMRFYAATYGLAGVFGTAFTVFLLSYYPQFLGTAGHIALIPFAISILAIGVHFFSIVMFWYGWDRFSKTTHYLIGALMAISALFIPLGFRAVFAFLNIPAGLKFEVVGSHIELGLDVSSALFKNPTFIPLYLKSLAGAFTLTFTVLLGIYGYRGLTSKQEDIKRRSLRFATGLLWPSAIGLTLMLFMGLWYALSLENVPYKFNNIFSSLGWKVLQGRAYYNVSWLFVIKMILYVIQVLGVTYAFMLLRSKASKANAKAILLLIMSISAMGTLAAGELLNAYSQYPFFIAVWPDVLSGTIQLKELVTKYGVTVVSPDQNAIRLLIDKVNSFVVLDGSSSARSVITSLSGLNELAQPAYLRNVVNEIAVTKPVILLTVSFVAALLIFAAWLLRVAITPKEEPE